MGEQPKCQLCGEPMPLGEEMFLYNGYSGPCPKSPFDDAAKQAAAEHDEIVRIIAEEMHDIYPQRIDPEWHRKYARTLVARLASRGYRVVKVESK